MGAIVASHYAERHPEHVKHLILAGPAAVRATDPRRVEAFLQSVGPARRSLYRFAATQWERGVTPQSCLRALPFDLPMRFVRGYVRSRWRAEATLDAATFKALYEYNTGVNVMPGVSEKVLSMILAPIGQARTPIADVLGRLPEHVPITFVYGEHDWMTPSSGAWVTKNMRDAGRTNVECHVLPDAGHYPFIDQPEMVHEIVKKAWQECDRR
jgi:pimeloyl-ACP methyl ester carboxylesterase